MTRPRWFTIIFVLQTALASPALGGAFIEFPSLPKPEEFNRGIEIKRYAYDPSSPESYLQTWNMYFTADNGYQVFANFVVSNLGFGDNACGLNIAVVSPSGASRVETKQFSGDEFQGVPGTLAMTCAQSSVQGDDQTITFSGEYAQLGIELTLTREGPGLDLNPMKLNGSPKDFVHFNMPHVTSRGSGKIKWDGRWVPVTGRGILVHIHQTVGIQEYSLQWDQMRALTPDTTLLLGGFQATKEYGEGVLVLVLARHGKIVHVSRDVQLSSSDFRPHGPSGYSIPHSFGIKAQDPHLSLWGRAESQYAVAEFDVLSHVSWFLRTLIRTFISNPWIFRSRVHIDVHYQLKGEPPRQLNVPGIYEAVFIND